MKKSFDYSFTDIATKRIDTNPNLPTIIFLHDSLGSIELWRDFPEKLSEITGYNVLVYDRQGYGNSCPFSYQERDKYYLELEADLLNQLLSYWGINEAILFGHSDGGSISLIMAAKYPEKIKAVITEGCHIFVDEVTLHGINEAVKTYETTNLHERLTKYHGDKTEKLFKMWVDTWRKDEFRDWSIEHLIPTIKCKILAIQGYNDEFGEETQIDGIVNPIPHLAQKWMIENVGHNPHKETPNEVLIRCKEFLLH